MDGSRDVEGNKDLPQLIVEACDEMGFEVMTQVVGREKESLECLKFGRKCGHYEQERCN